ncbi:MAG: hypothetical protein ABSA93_28730 [Streptosporangiaceae bacterium]
MRLLVGGRTEQQRHVDRAAFQRRAQLCAAVEPQVDPPPGEGGVQHRGEPRQQLVGSVFRRADRERLRGIDREVLQDLIVDGQHLPRLAQEGRAIAGEPHAAMITLHERAADRGLQAAHVLADGPLAEMQRARGTLEASIVDHGHQTS